MKRKLVCLLLAVVMLSAMAVAAYAVDPPSNIHPECPNATSSNHFYATGNTYISSITGDTLLEGRIYYVNGPKWDCNAGTGFMVKQSLLGGAAVQAGWYLYTGSSLIRCNVHEHGSFATGWTQGTNGHWHACGATGCDVTETNVSTHTTDGFAYAAHSGGIATCQAAAVCDYCFASYGNVGNHNWGTWTDGSRSCQTPGCSATDTCQHGGASSGICQTCGKDLNPPPPPPPHTHNYTNWTPVDKTSHKGTCTCGDTSTVDHNWVRNADGSTTSCETCGAYVTVTAESGVTPKTVAACVKVDTNLTGIDFSVSVVDLSTHTGISNPGTYSAEGNYQAIVDLGAQNNNPYADFTLSNPKNTAATGDNRPIELLVFGFAAMSVMAAAAFTVDRKRR